MQTITTIVYMTIFGYIAIIKNLINCNHPIHYKTLTIFVVISLIIGGFVIYMNKAKKVTI